MSKTTIGKAALLAAIALNLVACAHAPSSPQLSAKNTSATVKAQGVETDIRLIFTENNMLNYSAAILRLCSFASDPSLGTPEEIKANKLKVMDTLDKRFTDVLSLKKPLLLGADKYKICIQEASLGRQAYIDYLKNPTPENLNPAIRNMLLHMINIFTFNHPVKDQGVQITATTFKILVLYPDCRVQVSENNESLGELRIFD